MSSAFEIQHNPFRLFFRKRQLFAFYDHYLMFFDLSKLNIPLKDISWTVESINLNNVECCRNECFALGRMRNYLLKKKEHVDGFLFRDPKTEEAAGFIWIMYPKCNEFQYRIRKVDSFVFDVYVSPAYRGYGLCGQMFQHIFTHIKNKQLTAVALGVRTDNTSAIRAYEKAGGIIKSRKRYIQIVHRYNIPYYTV